MIKLETTEVFGWEAAIRGLRNPMNSWDKRDSDWEFVEDPSIINPNDEVKFVLGENDLKLMKSLSKAGSDHAKFLRMINVTVDITAPLYWWKEFDTYKVGTVANSCSTMHKIHAKEFTLEDFSIEHLMDEFDVKEGVSIYLDKHIPVAAGMAGGSSNAAAVLFGINRMFDLGLSQQDLMDRGVTLGADVPYCIMRGTVLAEGIGEILTPLPALPKCYVLIAKPPISVSTKLVYEKLDSHEIENHPDIDGILEGLEAQDIKKVAECMGNVLEKVTVEEYPVIDKIKNVMKEEGALNAMMSGSGPTVFGIFDNKHLARKAADKIRKMELAKQVYVTNVHNARRK